MKTMSRFQLHFVCVCAFYMCVYVCVCRRCNFWMFYLLQFLLFYCYTFASDYFCLTYSVKYICMIIGFSTCRLKATLLNVVPKINNFIPKTCIFGYTHTLLLIRIKIKVPHPVIAHYELKYFVLINVKLDNFSNILLFLNFPSDIWIT